MVEWDGIFRLFRFPGKEGASLLAAFLQPVFSQTGMVFFRAVFFSERYGCLAELEEGETRKVFLLVCAAPMSRPILL